MAIVYVQQIVGGSVTANGALATSNATFASNITAGNTLIVQVGFKETSAVLYRNVTISDTLGNTFTQFGTRSAVLNSGGTSGIVGWYATNISGGANTVSLVGSCSAIAIFNIVAYEYSGINTATPLDIAGSSAGAGDVGGKMITGTITTTNASDLLFASIISEDSAGGGSAVTGWGHTGTTQITNTNPVMLTADQLVSSTGNYAGTFQVSANKFVSLIGAFQQAASGAVSSSQTYLSLMGAGNI